MYWHKDMTLGCSFLTVYVPGGYGYVFNIVTQVCSFIVNRSKVSLVGRDFLKGT